MRKRFRIALIILLVAMVGGVVWQVVRPRQREPVYQGKPISYWIDHGGWLSKGVPNLGRGDEFPQIDSNAVPFLAKALQRKDGGPSLAYQTMWRRTPVWLQNYLPRPIWASTVRRNASIALAKLGQDAKPAIPALVRMMKEDGDPIARMHAVQALEQIDPRDKIVREGLIGASNDKELLVRLFAKKALYQIDPAAAGKAMAK